MSHHTSPSCVQYRVSINLPVVTPRSGSLVGTVTLFFGLGISPVGHSNSYCQVISCQNKNLGTNQ